MMTLSRKSQHLLRLYRLLYGLERIIVFRNSILFHCSFLDHIKQPCVMSLNVHSTTTRLFCLNNELQENASPKLHRIAVSRAERLRRTFKSDYSRVVRLQSICTFAIQLLLVEKVSARKLNRPVSLHHIKVLTI